MTVIAVGFCKLKCKLKSETKYRIKENEIFSCWRTCASNFRFWSTFFSISASTLMISTKWKYPTDLYIRHYLHNFFAILMALKSSKVYKLSIGQIVRSITLLCLGAFWKKSTKNLQNYGEVSLSMIGVDSEVDSN